MKKSIANFVFKFYSEGPRGKIKKVVIFRHARKFGENVFNLAFGDQHELPDQINDVAISNNNDPIKVLNTVALTVVDFIEKRPNAIILIEGSTLSRTRLYQMRISFHWLEISEYYEVYGEYGKKWLPFQKGVNYKRFLVFKKNQ
ncbi:MAG TPA: hypothetical protein VNS58_01985 [Puia sp.]|nr:hypothetical protein [Puia sp.]